MKKLFSLALAMCLTLHLLSQSFNDDFESYTAGASLTKNSTIWKKWANDPARDINVTSVKAHSGSNSLYFVSTIPTGGPADILLPFGGEHETGNFSLELWMFVESGKCGYFNLQGNINEGITWSVVAEFKNDGSFIISNLDDGVLLTGNYSQNKWLDIKLGSFLNTSNWNLFIDNNLKGSFSNSITKVASLDIYASSECSFYVDDVSYTYTPYVMPNLNAALQKIGNLTLPGQAVTPSLTVRNLGKSVITSLEVELEYNGVTQSKSVSGLTLASLGMTTVYFSSPISLILGAGPVKAILKKVNGGNDNDSSDNFISVNINGPAPGKIVFAEASTGSWNGWAPRGISSMNQMSKKYGDLFAGVNIHNIDPMTLSIYDKAFSPLATGYINIYLSSLVEREAITDPLKLENEFLSRILISPIAKIKNGASYDQNTGALNVSLTSTFNTNISGNYKIACILTEDSVKGAGSKYAQTNYYAGGGQGPMGGFETLPNPVPANQMVYNHVARAIAPGFTGLSHAFSNTVIAGSIFTHNFSFNIKNYNPLRMHIIGIIISPNGIVQNCSFTNIQMAVSNGFITGSTGIISSSLNGPDEVSVYPNPASDNIRINNLPGDAIAIITDLSGKEMQSTYINDSNNEIPLVNIQNGLYFVKINIEGRFSVFKIVVNK